MTTLLHTPLSPFGRLARLALAEDGRPAELVETPPSQDALDEALNLAHPLGPPTPAARLLAPIEAPLVEPYGAPMGPVLLAEGTVLGDVGVICAYLEETREPADSPPAPRGGAAERAEARRLAAWALDVFWREAVLPALDERYLKSVYSAAPPNTTRLRSASLAARQHLDAAGALIEARGWLAGERLSLADLALAAQVSVLDYLGSWPFGDGPDPARDWYALVKSRPSFRAILADRVPRLPPSDAYQELDF